LIGRLSGRVVDEAADGTVVLDVQGVGYEVVVPIGALGRLLAGAGPSAAPRSSAGAEVSLFVHTHVREDAIALYGFAAREDRAAFRALIGVSGIGPKIAMAVLSALPGPELSSTVGRGDVNKLTKIPGIGKRTAERIVLELKEKLPAVAGVARSEPGASPAAPRGGQAELVQRALVEMGFRGPEAERAVASLGDKIDTSPLPDLVRQALAQLVR
jgi:holliday junction DNA helicase RuvA